VTGAERENIIPDPAKLPTALTSTKYKASAAGLAVKSTQKSMMVCFRFPESSQPQI